MKYPAIGMIETNSIARGIVVHDVMLKKAKIEVVQSNSICPGKYIVLIAGDEGDVDEAMKEGLAKGSEAVVDSLFIPNVRHEIFPAMVGANQEIGVDSLVIVETFSVSSAILLSDIALKRNNVTLLDLRLAQGLGGKAFFLMTGPLFEVEETAKHLAEEAEPGMLTNIEVIARPHEGLRDAIGGRIL
jgi:microcompartment protein CcmL/EutN